MRNIREDIKNFIVKKVKESVSPERPYFFVRWSGLFELCKSYGLDLLELVDELCSENRLKKALIRKKLALTLPDMITTQKTKALLKEFKEFIS